MSTISREKDVSGYRELSGTSMAVSEALIMLALCLIRIQTHSFTCSG
jgi:hypothetical protein